MNSITARHLVNVLIESPLYLGLPLKERRRLIAEFTALYSLVTDNAAGRPDPDEPAKEVKEQSIPPVLP